MAKKIPIGLSDGRKVYLSPERRAVHTHVIGASGQGKSKFLEHCMREDILAGHGMCLIDPEGDLYEAIVKFCLQIGIDQYGDRKIHLFDPSEPNWRFRFNPLFVHDGEKPRHRVDNVIEALAQVWGGEDSRNTPSIRTTIRAIFSALVSRGYTLAEAFYLTNTFDPYQIIEYLTHDLENPIMSEIWEGYKQSANAAKREHMIEFSGSRRRLSELLSDDELREILAAYEDPIDFKQVMDNGDIVLINLSPEAMGDDPARAFGALFLREMFYCASRRTPSEAQEKPFFAYIDECADYLTNDIARILARSRKRGFHVILAHQWLEQLREQGSSIYHGVMGIQNKVVFGGLSDEDAVIMADQLFRSEYDLETPIKALTKPGVAGYRRTWLNNWSMSESVTRGESESWSETESEGEVISSVTSTGTNDNTSVAQVYDEDGWPSGFYTVNTGSGTSTVDAAGIATSTGRSSSYTYTTSRSETSGSSHGASEAIVPILKNFVGGVHSLENVRHMAVARLRSIPPRNAVVKGFNTPTFDITTYDLEPTVVSEGEYSRKKQLVFSASPYTIETDQAKRLMEQVRLQLQDTAKNFDPTYMAPDEDDDDGLG